MRKTENGFSCMECKRLNKLDSEESRKYSLS